MKINDFLQKNKHYTKGGSLKTRPWIVCNSGLIMSVQASHSHYCNPRQDDVDKYISVEIGFPNMVVDELLPYAECEDEPTETVYGWVPVELVDEIIEKNGGMDIEKIFG